jgi:hypothetical protein
MTRKYHLAYSDDKLILEVLRSQIAVAGLDPEFIPRTSPAQEHIL